MDFGSHLYLLPFVIHLMPVSHVYMCCLVCIFSLWDTCRFTGSVKLKGVIVIGGEEDTHPAVMKLYVIAIFCLFYLKAIF